MPNLPTGWDLVHVANAGEVQLGRQRTRAAGRGLGETPYLRVANVLDGHIDFSDVMEMRFTVREREVFCLRPGDVLLNEGQSIDLVGRSAIYRGPPGRVCFQNSLVRFRCNDTTVPGFARAVFKHWLDSGRFMQVARQTTSMAHLGADRFASMRFPRPPAPEQRRIAEILDAADETIRGTEAVIAKLHLERRGLLLRLVESGNHEVRQLRDAVVRVEAGKSPDLPDHAARPGGWGVLKVSAIGDGTFIPDENKEVTSSSLERAEYEVRHGDVLVSRANTSELVGLACYASSPPPHLMLCDKTLRLVIREQRAVPRYVALVLGSKHVRRQISIHATGTSGSMKNISQCALLALRVSMPARDEQQRIVSILSGADARIAAETLYVNKLRHLKQGLTQDLLTGRVRMKA